MYTRPLYEAIAQYVDSAKQELKYEYALEALMKHMPSGSGIDSGTKLLIAESNQEKLVFSVEYHHMNQNGFYCGWSSRLLTITPTLLSEFKLDFSDEDYSGVDCQNYDEETNEEYDDEESFHVEDYLADTYRFALQQHVEIDMSLFEPTSLTWHGELVVS